MTQTHCFFFQANLCILNEKVKKTLGFHRCPLLFQLLFKGCLMQNLAFSKIIVFLLALLLMKRSFWDWDRSTFEVLGRTSDIHVNYFLLASFLFCGMPPRLFAPFLEHCRLMSSVVFFAGFGVSLFIFFVLRSLPTQLQF